MTDPFKSSYRCELCSIDFTSGIPYEMHLKGSKHARKLKEQVAVQSIHQQVVQSKEISKVGNALRCDLCNVIANSSLQLQMHLVGVKHKAKVEQSLQPKEVKQKGDCQPKNSGAVEGELNVKQSQPSAMKLEDKKLSHMPTAVNGKSNGGGVVRPLPPEFGEPRPAKMGKFSCSTCRVNMNSQTQLQQHLDSRRHQAKVEGKPLEKKPFKPKSLQGEATASPSTTGSKTVVGVKTLAASFVRAETIQ